MRIVAGFLAAVLLAGPARSEGDLLRAPTVFSRIEAGILCPDGIGRREAAPDATQGYVNIVDTEVKLGAAIRRLPALPGLSFGVVFQMAKKGKTVPMQIVVTHPPIGPEGRTQDMWKGDVFTDGPNASFFRFHDEEELVPGAWAIEGLSKGRHLFSAPFWVVDPAEMPDFVDPCSGETPNG